MIDTLRVAPLLLSWLGCFWLCRELAARKHVRPGWPISWILASAVWGSLLTWIVEVSSFFGRLTAATLFVTWSSLTVALLFFAGWLARRRGFTWEAARTQARSHVLALWASWPPDVIVTLVLTGLLIAMLGFNAWEMTTNNSDSLGYHLPRVMHWMQNQTVAHYPTNDFRQNEWAPWPAFVQVSFHLLQGSDRWANMVQWFAMLSCVLTVPWIAGELWDWWPKQPVGEAPTAAAGNTRARLGALAMILVATLPIGVCQAVSTQTDYVCACWLLWLMTFALLLLRDPDNGWYAWGAALTFSLGTLSKPTMLIYAAPLLGALAVWQVMRKGSWRGRGRMGAMFVLLFAAINGPHMWRNYSATGSPLSRRHTFILECNRTLSIGGTLSNVIRNLALETETGIAPLARGFNGLLGAMHRLTGRDLNDPDTTYYMSRFEFTETCEMFDCQASNLPHLFLLLAAVGLVLAAPRPERRLLLYPLLALAGFILFCALLRWNRWHSRFHLAWFVLTMPWVAVVLVRRLWSPLLALLPFLLFCVGLAAMFHNKTRPILDRTVMTQPREEQYLAVQEPTLWKVLDRLSRSIVASGCQEVGLKLPFLDYGGVEYAIWMALKNHGFEGRIDHVFVEDGPTPAAHPPPCAVIVTGEGPLPAALTNAFPRREEYGTSPYTTIRVYWPARAPDGASRTEPRPQ